MVIEFSCKISTTVNWLHQAKYTKALCPITQAGNTWKWSSDYFWTTRLMVYSCFNAPIVKIYKITHQNNKKLNRYNLRKAVDPIIGQLTRKNLVKYMISLVWLAQAKHGDLQAVLSQFSMVTLKLRLKTSWLRTTSCGQIQPIGLKIKHISSSISVVCLNMSEKQPI